MHTKGNGMKLGTVGLAGIVSLFAAASVAMAAGSSSASGYGGAAGAVQSQVASATKGAVKGGTLPFTGLNIGLIVVGAVVLLVAGFALQKFSRGKA